MPRFRQHVDAVAARCGQPAATTGAVINAHNEQIVETLLAGERVVIDGFGTFRLTDRGVPVFVASQSLTRRMTPAPAGDTHDG